LANDIRTKARSILFILRICMDVPNRLFGITIQNEKNCPTALQ
jgi:hypothetical protein